MDILEIGEKLRTILSFIIINAVFFFKKNNNPALIIKIISILFLKSNCQFTLLQISWIKESDARDMHCCCV